MPATVPTTVPSTKVATPAEGRRERKKRETRERILHAARGLFIEQGFEASTVEAIAEAADISKPTLFNYFPSKVALLQAMLPDVDRRFAAALTDQPEAPADVSGRLDGFFAAVAGMTQVTPKLTSAMLLQALRAYEDPRGSLTHHRFPQTRDALIGLLQEGVARGEVRRDIPVTRMTDYITGIYVYGLLNWLADPAYPLQRELAEAGRFLAPALRGEPE